VGFVSQEKSARMARKTALGVNLVTIRTTTTLRVLVVRMENIPNTTFKPRWNRVQIVPTADILPRLVSPVHSVAMLVLLESIPTKKE
tara:strand:+ start:149 stop:409 length:261 start_codon:yes stop_codon:yes gene_type:complete